MRKRSETIYATTEEEYKQMLEDIEHRDSKRRKSKEISIGEDIADDLVGFTNYDMTPIQQTIHEREMLDEGMLLETIEQMNKNYQRFNGFSLKYDSDVSCLSKDSFTISTGETTEDNGSLEVLINQNLVNYEESIKLIVLGERGVGKSLFVKKFISTDNEKENLKMYTPTESLEIKKTFIKVHHKNIKVEVWDTNMSVINSALIKSISTFLTVHAAFYKITNGYVLIADYDRIETLCFVEKQIENIIEFSQHIDNILLIVNKRNYLKNNDCSFVENKLKSIDEKFSIKGVILDLSSFSKDEKYCEQYYHTVLYNKTGNKNRYFFDCNGQDIESSVKRSQTMSHSSQVCNNVNSSGDQLYINISKKRNSGIKRDLIETFQKVNIAANSIDR